MTPHRENHRGNVSDHIESLVERYPALMECRQDIERAFALLVETYRKEGKLLVCGNGGSAADSGHIVGELMKGFRKERKLPGELRTRIEKKDPDIGGPLAANLQGTLTAISLTEHVALTSAFGNDVDPQMGFAQQVLGYGRGGDCLLGISTSGNAENVVNALYLASVLEMSTIGMTGGNGGKMKDLCDICIRVPGEETARIQELHLPLYHTLCAMLEEYFFPG